MKKLILLSLTVVAIAFCSCSEDELITFDSRSATLNIVKSYFLPEYIDIDLDTLNFFAVFNAGKATTDVKIPIRMSGAVVDKDRAYKIRIVTSKSSENIIAGQHYTLAEEQILSAGAYADSAIININTARLKADKISGLLVLELVPNENFSMGIEQYQSIGIRLSGVGFIEQPIFWNKNDLSDYGGAYSSIKAEKYAELNGVSSDKWVEDSMPKLYAYGKRTHDWFVAHPTYDDGVLVEFKGKYQY